MIIAAVLAASKVGTNIIILFCACDVITIIITTIIIIAVSTAPRYSNSSINGYLKQQQQPSVVAVLKVRTNIKITADTTVQRQINLYPKYFNFTSPHVLPSHFLHIFLPFLSLFYFILFYSNNHWQSYQHHVMSTVGISTLICRPITIRNTIANDQVGNFIYTKVGHTILIYILPGIHHFGCSACGFFSSFCGRFC